MTTLDFAALGRVPSGLFILTAATEAGGTGMLASWVQQCSFDPPRVTVALNPGRYVAGLLSPGAVFGLSQLAAGQTNLLAHFGRGFEPGVSAFQGIDTRSSSSGVTIIASALAFLDCRVVSRHPAGDHDLLIADVMDAIMLNDSSPYVHIRKSGANY